MTEFDRKFVKAWKEKYIGKARSVLDVGSRNINGDIRDIFADAEEFVGIDEVAGDGVDIVMSGRDMDFENQFDVVTCLNTMEHDLFFWFTLGRMWLALKRGGYLIISTPTFGFPLHRHPQDYYRFGEDAYRRGFFAGGDYELLELEEFFTKTNERGEGINPVIIAIGRKL